MSGKAVRRSREAKYEAVVTELRQRALTGSIFTNEIPNGIQPEEQRYLDLCLLEVDDVRVSYKRMTSYVGNAMHYTWLLSLSFWEQGTDFTRSRTPSRTELRTWAKRFYADAMPMVWFSVEEAGGLPLYHFVVYADRHWAFDLAPAWMANMLVASGAIQPFVLEPVILRARS